MIEALHRGTSIIKNVHMLEKSSLFVDAEQDLKEIVLDEKEREKLSKLGHFKTPLIKIFLRGVIKDIVKVCSLFPQYNLSRYEG